MSKVSNRGTPPRPRPNVASQVRSGLNKASAGVKKAGTTAVKAAVKANTTLAAKGATSLNQVSSFTKATSTAVGNAAKTTGTAVGNAARATGTAVGNAARATGTAVGNAATATSAAAGKWHAGAVKTATANAQALGSGGALAKVKTRAGLAGGLYGVKTYGTGLVNAIKNKEGGHAIADNALRLTKATLSTAQGALNTAAYVSGAKDFSKLSEAAKAAVGTKGGKFSSTIAEAAATAVHNGKPLRNVDVMASIAKTQGIANKITVPVKTAAADLLRSGGFVNKANALDASVVKAGQAVVDAATAGKTVSAAKASTTAVQLATGVADDIAKGAAKGAGVAAKTAGRFTPGLNVAMAAVDVGIAARTLADPNASVAAKVTTSITAAGSVLAATNIPIVSQVGAAVSLVSTGVGAVIENAGAIKDGLKAAGSAIADGAKAAGSAIAGAAKKVFSGW